MKVRAKQLKEIEVELSDFTIREIVLETFCKVFDMPVDSYIKNGKLMHGINHTSNSLYEDVEIREATENDIAANYILKRLKREL